MSKSKSLAMISVTAITRPGKNGPEDILPGKPFEAADKTQFDSLKKAGTATPAPVVAVSDDADKVAADKVAADKAATDKAATDKAATDKAATDKAATGKAAADKAATDKATPEKDLV